MDGWMEGWMDGWMDGWWELALGVVTSHTEDVACHDTDAFVC